MTVSCLDLCLHCIDVKIIKYHRFKMFYHRLLHCSRFSFSNILGFLSSHEHIIICQVISRFSNIIINITGVNWSVPGSLTIKPVRNKWRSLTSLSLSSSLCQESLILQTDHEMSSSSEVCHGLVIRLGNHWGNNMRELPGDLEHVGQLQHLGFLVQHLSRDSGLNLSTNQRLVFISINQSKSRIIIPTNQRGVLIWINQPEMSIAYCISQSKMSIVFNYNQVFTLFSWVKTTWEWK